MPRGVSLLDEARLQGRLWTPRGFYGPRILADFDAREGVTVNGSTINWVDRVNGIVATGTGVFSIGGLNGRPTLLFNGSQYVNAPFVYSLTGIGISAVIVASMTALTNYGRAATLINAGQTNDYDNPDCAVLLDTGANSAIVRAERASNSAGNFTVQLGVPFVSTTIINPASTYSFALNDNTPGSAATSGTFTGSNLFIGVGKQSGSVSFFWNGAIARVLLVSGAVTQREASLLAASVAWASGLEKSLNQLRSPFVNRPPLIGD